MKYLALFVALIILLFNGAHEFRLRFSISRSTSSEVIWEDAYEKCDKQIPEATFPDAQELKDCKIEPLICTGPVLNGKRQDLMRECTWTEARKTCRKTEPDLRICGQ
jgi:hypothetical protein